MLDFPTEMLRPAGTSGDHHQPSLVGARPPTTECPGLCPTDTECI